jgi:hypothetical protein
MQCIGVSGFDAPTSTFNVRCVEALAGGSDLHYLIGNLPAHVVEYQDIRVVSTEG